MTSIDKKRNHTVKFMTVKGKTIERRGGGTRTYIRRTHVHISVCWANCFLSHVFRENVLITFINRTMEEPDALLLNRDLTGKSYRDTRLRSTLSRVVGVCVSGSHQFATSVL